MVDTRHGVELDPNPLPFEAVVQRLDAGDAIRLEVIDTRDVPGRAGRDADLPGFEVAVSDHELHGYVPHSVEVKRNEESLVQAAHSSGPRELRLEKRDDAGCCDGGPEYPPGVGEEEAVGEVCAAGESGEQESATEISSSLRSIETALVRIARRERDTVAVARTLTQHAAPTTVGLRAATWLSGIRRARIRLADARAALPVQLGGAVGTLASFVELSDAGTARRLVEAYADVLGLASPDAPWHTARWPVTELGDALVQTIDALGAMATDVATLSRTEIGEVSEGGAGGSSAMPQKRNPVAAVLIRSAALRAPQLGAGLHLSAALAGDERPDGAWHAEWSTLRELLRLALGASATASRLATGLRLDPAAVARNLAAIGSLVVSERVALTLAPIVGHDRAAALVTEARNQSDLAALVADTLSAAGEPWSEERISTLLNPSGYTGLACEFVDDIVGAADTDAEGKE